MNFRILQRRSVYQGRAIRVEQVDVRLPDGRQRCYDLVAHSGSVTILPFDEQGNIWFVLQYRLGSESMLLELPAGTLEPGENPDDCAAREVREEIGMAAGNLKKLGKMYLAPGYSSEFMHLYLATELKADPLQADADEFIEIQRIPLRKVYDMVKAGEIQDAKSLAVLLLALPELSQSFSM